MDFEALVIEGVFTADGVEWDPESFSPKVGDISIICTGKDPVSLETELVKLQNKTIRLTFHHMPPEPPEMEKWGVGSCLCMPMGWCPYDHHLTPHLNFHYEGSGTLIKEESGWVLETEEGRDPLQFQHLVGHHARCAGVTTFDLEKMKEKVSEATEKEDMSSVYEQLGEAQRMMGHLKDVLDRFK